MKPLLPSMFGNMYGLANMPKNMSIFLILVNYLSASPIFASNSYAATFRAVKP